MDSSRNTFFCTYQYCPSEGCPTYIDRAILRTVKRLFTVLIMVPLITTTRISCAQDRVGVISGTVADASGGMLPGATVMIRSQDTQASQTFITDSHGEFTTKPLTPGVYTVEAWHKFFERSSHPSLRVSVGLTTNSDFKLDLCRMRHLDPRLKPFATRFENSAKTDPEKELVSKAVELPCPAKQKSEPPLDTKAPDCANFGAMHYYTKSVEMNRNGHLPEAGEGPVLAGAYYGATVAFDQPTKQWLVKLRLEYSVVCEMLCGVATTYDRWVYFDQSGAVTKVDDEWGCNLELVS